LLLLEDLVLRSSEGIGLRPARLLLMLGLSVAAAGCAHKEASLEAAAQALAAELPDWSARGLPGKRSTAYGLASRGGRSCVLAQAEQSASLWRRRLSIAPEALAGLEFSWWLLSAQAEATVTQAERDDAPARLVLAFEGDVRRLSLRNRSLFELMETISGEAPPYATLMYAWDSRGAAAETVVTSSHSDRVRKIVVGSGPAPGRWLDFQRDVRADFERAYGEPPGALIGAALMTDADNTRSRKSACYGDVVFRSAQGEVLPGSLRLRRPAAGETVRLTPGS
jgi:hypothetical protein